MYVVDDFSCNSKEINVKTIVKIHENTLKSKNKYENKL